MDTATPAVTVALHDGTSVVAESGQVDARRHGELLLPTVDRVLAEAGTTLDAVTGIVVGVGPGPYTGLRVGLVTAATFASALSVPVHGLCTLDGLAYAAGEEAGITGPFAVATDARRKEVYWARYADPAPGPAAPPSTGRPTSPRSWPASPSSAPERCSTPIPSPTRAAPSTSRPGRSPRSPPNVSPRARSCSTRSRSTSAGPTRRSRRTTRWSPRSDRPDR